MRKKILIVVFLLFVGMQLFQPERNLSDDQTFHISNEYEVLGEVSTILETACYDCHSNKTRYPWYANVMPVAYFLNDHVTDGKRHLNFSSFTNRSIALQNHKLEEIIEEVEEGEMPLESYTALGLHPEANLTDAQRQVLIDWAEAQMAMLKNKYPEDSLKMPSRR